MAFLCILLTPARFSDVGSDDEFESVSQVTGPVSANVVNVSGNGDMYVARPLFHKT